MSRVLIPLPSHDFDPTEAAVPWAVLSRLGHEVCFATPDGRPGSADARMVTGAGLGIWKPVLQADVHGRQAHAAMVDSAAFRQPLRHADARIGDFDGLVLPGGHAPGMRPYLESPVLQQLVAQAFDRRQPVGAICHGVLLAARARRSDGRSVLHGLRSTALTRTLELSGWAMTAAWLGRYYRTYPQTVQREVTKQLAQPSDFVAGPMALRRDSPARPDIGFSLRDGHYLSARWPGDAHRFANDFAAMLAERSPARR